MSDYTVQRLTSSESSWMTAKYFAENCLTVLRLENNNPIFIKNFKNEACLASHDEFEKNCIEEDRWNSLNPRCFPNLSDYSNSIKF